MECPLCSADRFSEWTKVGEYHILRCGGCRLGITAPFPTREDIRSSNAKMYRLDDMVQVYTSRERHFRKRYGKHVESIRKFAPGGKLLDVGCNVGFFLKTARDAGYETTGVEPNEECAAYGKNRFGLDVRPDYLENLRFPGESFDVVTLFDVLEHVPHPRPFLAEIRRILKPDGLFVVQVPNLDSLMARIAGPGWGWLCPPDHLFHFHPEALDRLLRSEGFRPVRSSTWEPLTDFCGALFPGWKPGGFIGKCLVRGAKGALYLPIRLLRLNKAWWKRGRGGLILVFARKGDRGESRETSPGPSAAQIIRRDAGETAWTENGS